MVIASEAKQSKSGI